MSCVNCNKSFEEVEKCTCENCYCGAEMCDHEEGDHCIGCHEESKG